jgi:hypothetical protein
MKPKLIANLLFAFAIVCLGVVALGASMFFLLPAVASYSGPGPINVCITIALTASVFAALVFFRVKGKIKDLWTFPFSTAPLCVSLLIQLLFGNWGSHAPLIWLTIGIIIISLNAIWRESIMLAVIAGMFWNIFLELGILMLIRSSRIRASNTLRQKESLIGVILAVGGALLSVSGIALNDSNKIDDGPASFVIVSGICMVCVAGLACFKDTSEPAGIIQWPRDKPPPTLPP